jgi:hypothetical protein
LATAGEFSIETQVHLVLALLGLFNFIRQQEGVDLPEDIDEGAGDAIPLPETTRSQGTDAMKAFRDKIAKQMWKDYCDYIGREY